MDLTNVAVGTRFPIGYNEIYGLICLLELRLARVSPSAIMRRPRRIRGTQLRLARVSPSAIIQ